MPPKSTPQQATPRLFSRRLVAWFRRHGRDLPWRRTRDPWRIVVSEFMLQQTQVARVEQYYPRFLKQFPTIGALAIARPGRVREAWEGLGYYRRAVNLHRLARDVMRDHQGKIPGKTEILRRLPGVGRYTAGAVASFAFEHAVPAVDTNVARVLRRVFHPRAGSDAAGQATLWNAAARLHSRPGPRAWALNQAIMELGAVICTARVARCGECPVVRECKTGRQRQQSTVNGQRELPRKRVPAERVGPVDR
jgi:A/G-specific adenine glycosylase